MVSVACRAGTDNMTDLESRWYPACRHHLRESKLFWRPRRRLLKWYRRLDSVSNHPHIAADPYAQELMIRLFTCHLLLCAALHR
jgi:hypothetical protein